MINQNDVYGDTCRNCGCGWFKTTEDVPRCHCGCHQTFDRILKLHGGSKSEATETMITVIKEHRKLQQTEPALMAAFDEIVDKCKADPSMVDTLSMTELYILKEVSEKSKFFRELNVRGNDNLGWFVSRSE